MRWIRGTDKFILIYCGMRKKKTITKKDKDTIKKFLRKSFWFLWWLFIEVFKYVVIWVLAFYVVKFWYFLINRVSWQRYSDDQIIKEIKKSLPSDDVVMDIFVLDLKWLWSKSIVVFSWLPSSKKHPEIFNDDVDKKYYPKIMVFDKIQKNAIEDIIFGVDLYKLSYEVQLSKTKIPEWFSLWDVYQINVGWKDMFIFTWFDLGWWSVVELYDWILKYSFSDWYNISSLLTWINNISLNWYWEIELFSEKPVNLVVNGKQEATTLTFQSSENSKDVSWDIITQFHSLWIYSSDEYESHADCHDVLEVKYNFDSYKWAFSYNPRIDWYILHWKEECNGIYN